MLALLLVNMLRSFFGALSYHYALSFTQPQREQNLTKESRHRGENKHRKKGVCLV